MDSDQHVAANEQVYDTSDPIERRDHPLVMKIEQCYVPVFAADDLPTDALGLPAAVLASTRIDNPPTVKEVLVAKAERAAQLLKWNAIYDPRTGRHIGRPEPGQPELFGSISVGKPCCFIPRSSSVSRNEAMRSRASSIRVVTDS